MNAKRSKPFLYDLNGKKQGRFKSYLDNFKGEPRIAWYPSCGRDFRALMYLSPQYNILNPPLGRVPESPDLFLYTDYYPWVDDDFLDSADVFDDGRTKIKISYIEMLPYLKLSLHEDVVDFPEHHRALNTVLFMGVDIESKTLGKISFPVLYVFAVNEFFLAEKILPLKAKISHLIYVRYGGGCGGGGRCSGRIIKDAIPLMGCEQYVSDLHFYGNIGDDYAKSRYPVLHNPEFDPQWLMPAVRVLDAEHWSGNGKVHWLNI